MKNLPPGWPRDKEDLQEDAERAMRGYKPNIWDPYKDEAERLERLGLEPTATNNMVVKLIIPAIIVGLVAAYLLFW
jgi:hypothetical protein